MWNKRHQLDQLRLWLDVLATWNIVLDLVKRNLKSYAVASVWTKQTSNLGLTPTNTPEGIFLPCKHRRPFAYFITRLYMLWRVWQWFCHGLCQCTMPKCATHKIQYTCSAPYTALRTLHFQLCTIQFARYTLHIALCPLDLELDTLPASICPSHIAMCILHIVCCTLSFESGTLFSVYCT